jgi:outer membrane lipoprotein
MTRWVDLCGPLAAGLLIAACSVMPAKLRNRAVSGVPFNSLIQDASRYIGRTVIVGGYVVKVQNEPDISRILAVQAPLGIGDEPKSKDLSQGRLILEFKGFLDPEVYTKDRKITAAGTLIGSSATEKNQAQFPYLQVSISQIYLWEKERPIESEPYWYWPPYPYYYPWGWRHPYFW